MEQRRKRQESSLMCVTCGWDFEFLKVIFVQGNTMKIILFQK